MQMPGQPPAERQRGQQRSSLLGEKMWGLRDIQKDKSRYRPSGKGCRPSSSNLSFPKHTHEMFHAARTEYKPLGLTNIYSFIESSVVSLIAVQGQSIPSPQLCMVLNGLHASWNRKLRRNNRYQVTTEIKSHSELQKHHATCFLII